MNPVTRRRFVLKPLVFIASLIPLGIAVGQALNLYGGLGANPIEALMDHFGNWALRFLMIALAVTPIRQLTGINAFGQFRRMLGLFAFFYVFMHFLVYLVLDQSLLVSAIFEDIVERPFITLGVIAFVVLLAMAVTSTAGMRRRLGKRWQKLHYGAYLAGVLGVWHYWWQVKSDIREPLVYAAILALLLGYRIYKKRAKRAT
ncbi:MAG: protein-methionine-sulfoxide reductase heme-binding subunit MsrQ [Pseudomonadota bacterium]